MKKLISLLLIAGFYQSSFAYGSNRSLEKDLCLDGQKLLVLPATQAGEAPRALACISKNFDGTTSVFNPRFNLDGQFLSVGTSSAASAGQEPDQLVCKYFALGYAIRHTAQDYGSYQTRSLEEFSYPNKYFGKTYWLETTFQFVNQVVLLCDQNGGIADSDDAGTSYLEEVVCGNYPGAWMHSSNLR